MHALCTCHHPRRPITRESSRDEWMHVDDEIVADTYHVHIYTAARDCDGRIDRYSIRPLSSVTTSDPDVQTDRYDLWTQTIRLYMPIFPGAHARVGAGEEEGSYLFTFDYHADTDEGYESGFIAGCDDPECDMDARSQRDRFAESMGY